MDRIDKQSFAEYGVVTETGTTAITGRFCAVQCLADTVFATFTEAQATGDAMTGFTVTAGQVLFGDITAITLTSGKIRAYKSQRQ